jgi:hypothetical protein
MVNQQLGILFGKPFVEELDFHIQDRFVTEPGPSVKKANEQNYWMPTLQ